MTKTKTTAKKSHRWHLLLILFFFAATGALVVLAMFQQPMNLVTDEPAEITAKRADKTNNAFYALADALALLPPPPPPLRLKDKDGLEFIYSVTTDGIGNFLEKWQPDVHPLMAEYFSAMPPVLEKAAAALEKPYFLYPPHSFTNSESEKLQKEQDALEELFDMFCAQARLHACSEDPAEDSCQFACNAMRLSNLLGSDGPCPTIPLQGAAVIISNASPAHQEKFKTLLTQLRADWKPPVNRIDRYIRETYAMKLGPDQLKMPWPVRVALNARLAQIKKAAHRDEPLVRKLNCLTTRQYDQYVRENPRHKNVRSWYNSVNSNFFATVDGLLTVIALESYYRDHGAYPNSLSDLVPQYLPQLPENPFVTEPLFYSKRGTDDYVLNWPRENGTITVHEPRAGAAP